MGDVAPVKRVPAKKAAAPKKRTPPKSQRRPDGRLRKHEAKRAVLKFAEEGVGPSESVTSLGFSVQTYEMWRKEDRTWAEQVSQALRLSKILMSRGKSVVRQVEDPGFAAFSERFCRAQVFPHMQNVVDLLEYREPSWLHPSMSYTRGERDLIIVNMPPEHGKTASLSINYVTYRIAMNPNIRVLIVSKTQQMAQKMLFAVKERLTAPSFSELIEEYAPRGGFNGGGAKWTQDTIYINPEVRDSGEKDPTVQALGIGSHIYGARADLIILDDCVDNLNAHDYEKQMDWIQSQVLSRLGQNGVMMLVGTRLASRDLYMEIQNESLYPENVSPWTALSMPAVLEFAERTDDWVTLWPRTNLPDVNDRSEQPDADGLYPKWDGPRLSKKRGRMTPNLWARVYQQAQVTEDTVFDPEAVRGCTNGHRNIGLIPAGRHGCRPDGMAGLVCVAGLDPATAGYTAMVVIGLDVRTKKRYVLDVFNKSGCKPDEIREGIYRFTEKYNVVEWVVETNGFQGFLAQDREVNQFLTNRGAMVRPHHTGVNKQDPDFGVSAMSGLFTGWREGNNLIELPSSHMSEPLKALVEQLCLWAPEVSQKKQKTDAVMALWMAELACQRRVDMASTYNKRHQTNPFLTRWDRSQQHTVDLMDIHTYDKLVKQ